MTDSLARLITTAQFAAAAGISKRHAIRAAVRGTWRGNLLSVKSTPGRGGKGGLVNLIRLDSLPPDVQVHFLEQSWAPPAPPAAAPTGRALVLTTAGTPRRVLKRRDWGAARVQVSRQFDCAVGQLVGEEALSGIADELDRRVKSLWASPAGQVGWRKVAAYGAIDLYELSRVALEQQGIDLAEDELRALCRLTRHYVAHRQRRKHRKTHTFLHDAKAFADALPAVRRERPAWPLQVVYGDGTALDVLFLRPDGGQWKIWLILWLDAATNRLFGHAYARPKGGGVKQEHVATSFVCLATAIGMPETVYIDRGGEYGWAKRLAPSGLAAVIQAQPYNARAKAIEPIIRVFGAHFLSQIPGYMGSDRMKKMTETVGRPTKPYPGSLQQLLAEINLALDHYNATAQAGLGDRSPDQAWQAAIDGGWRPSRVDPATMAEALGRRESRVVKRGVIRIGGADYSSDALAGAYDLEGEACTIAVPALPGFPPSLYGPDGRFVGLVYNVERYGVVDPAGAREAARLKSLRRQGARELERAAPPAAVWPYQQASLAQHAPPDDAAPGELLEIDGERGRAAAARRALPPPSPKAEIDRRELQRQMLIEDARKRRAAD